MSVKALHPQSNRCTLMAPDLNRTIKISRAAEVSVTELSEDYISTRGRRRDQKVCNTTQLYQNSTQQIEQAQRSETDKGPQEDSPVQNSNTFRPTFTLPPTTRRRASPDTPSQRAATPHPRKAMLPRSGSPRISQQPALSFRAAGLVAGACSSYRLVGPNDTAETQVAFLRRSRNPNRPTRRIAMSPIELPFLYQTRTILRCFSTSSKALRNHKHPAPSTPREEPSESFFSQKAKETAESTRSKSKPSITRTEKQVFDGIFHDIKTSSGRPENTKQFHNETDPNAIFRLFVQESGHHQIPAPGSPVEQKIQESLGSGWNEHLKRYPPILRHAALQLTRSEAAPAESGDQLPYISFQPSDPVFQHRPTDRKTRDPRRGVYRPLEAALETETDGNVSLKEGLQLRNFDAMKEDEIARGTFRGKTADYVEKELKRISEGLQSCTAHKSQSGAFKMWDICQKRILPIVLALNQQPIRSEVTNDEDLAEPVVNATQSSTKKTQRKQVTKKPFPPNEPSASPKHKHIAPTFPPGVSPIGVITTLYPTLTLLALRLFTTHFPTTPFPLSLYTTLKTTSPQSRILGLNIHFYNTLLRHLWDIYSDLHAMTSTLREMQASGVDFDGDTYAVIRHVEDDRWNELHAREGSRGVGWWARPDQLRGWGEVVLWKGIVAEKLQEQGMGHLLAEREYSRELFGAAETDEPEATRVWL